jgi:hypothetical protein
MFVVYYIMCVGVNITLATYGSSQSFWIAFWLQAIGWAAQIIVGHGIMEGKALTKPTCIQTSVQEDDQL